MRKIFVGLSLAVVLLIAGVAMIWPPILFALIVVVPLILLGIRDCLQHEHAVLRNFPIIGHFRYLMESVRPEINQYFVESNTDGVPFNREFRSVVYQRSKDALDTLPFGTQRDVYEVGYEWINHSLIAKPAPDFVPRIEIGATTCKQPYSASLFNISAMSFGALSKNAILALSKGAKKGGFYHNTGEGGLSPYHLEGGADLVWQIGTAYFGCRTEDGSFDEGLFAERSSTDNVKMIEIKLSQGAKPGHGGILPAQKLTPEIAKIRHVPLGKDVISPPAHSAFHTPRGLLEFVAKLRELSGGKPVGFKLCVGSRSQFLAICKAMVETEIRPDFITIDGSEGGTGAAPLEFSNSMGTPLNDALSFAHNALTGCDLRHQLKLIASGKVITGFHIANKLALGADLCNSARGMMFSLGCIQALRCNSNHCPVGIATQNPSLVAGLDVAHKMERVYQFQRSTVHSFLELLAAAGLRTPESLMPWHICRRVSETEIKNFAEIYPTLEHGALLQDAIPERWRVYWHAAAADRF